MKVKDYSFGSITIGGKEYDKDLWIINGKIKKRDKSISKIMFQTSHRIPLEEIKKIVTVSTKRVIVGTGESGSVSIEKEGLEFLKEKGINLEMYKSGDLALMKMKFSEEDSGIIHVTC